MKKFFELLLTAGLIALLLGVTSLAVSFPDVPRDGSERANAIYKLADNGIVGGYEDGNFRPNNFLTRAELCKIVNLVFGYNTPDTENFKDVKPTDWFYNYVLVAKKAGYIKGFEDETFRGNSNLTREQTCIIISRTAGLYDLPAFVTVKDKISDWAKADVMKVIANFVMAPDKDGNFRATENITRAELAMALDGFVKEIPVTPPSTPVGPSVPIGPSTPTVTTYTVKFYDAEGKVISTQSVVSGGSAIAPASPAKAEDKEYTYTFKGWSKIYNIVYSNMDVYPEYTKTAKKYTVKLVYGDGTTGTMPATIEVTYKEKLSNVLPNADSISNGNKLFAGWYAGENLIDDEAFADLNTDTLTAKWVTRFTVKFYDAEGKVIKTQTVSNGAKATAPTAPVKASDKENTYTFKAWDKSFSSVTSDLDVYPTYTSTPIIYKVKLNYGNGVSGTVTSEVSVKYGDTLSAVLPTTGFTKEGYVFDGWYDGSDAVSDKKYSDLKNTTLTAKWTAVFTVKFYNAEDSLLKSEVVRYGESATAPSSPSKASDNEYTYTFKAWDKSFSSVTANLEVRPTYNKTDRLYTLTLNFGDKTDTLKVKYFEKISDRLPTPTPSSSSVYFVGWYAGENLVDDETYADLSVYTITAKWGSVFTVKFYNAEGSVISTQSVKYGESATAPSSPSKASDNEYSYTFKAWDKTFSSVKADLEVRPTYNATRRTYTVILDFGNKTENKSVYWSQSLSEILPSSDPTASGKYFAGWYYGSVEITSQKYSDLTPDKITAKWVNNYTVKFYNASGSVISTQSVKAGGSAKAPSAPAKAKDNEYIYTFDKWDTDFTNVKSNLDVHPTYTSTLREYTVKLLYGNGTEGTMPASVSVTYNGLLLDVLPTTGFSNGEFLFDGWYIGSEEWSFENAKDALKNEREYFTGKTEVDEGMLYSDEKPLTLTAKWCADPDILLANADVREEMETVVSDIDNPLSYGFTRGQLKVLSPVKNAIIETILDARLGISVDKAYVIQTYSVLYIKVASEEYHKLSETGQEDFYWAIADNLTPTSVDYLIEFFDVDISKYTK